MDENDDLWWAGLKSQPADSPVFGVEPFTCESCGCMVITPLMTRSKDEALQEQERVKADHRKECKGALK